MPATYRTTIKYPKASRMYGREVDYFFHMKADRNAFMDAAEAKGCIVVSWGIVHVDLLHEAIAELEEAFNETEEAE